MTENYDQTQFVTEEPLYEQSSKAVVPPANLDVVTPKPKRPPLLLILGGVALLSMVVAISLIVMRKAAPPTTVPTESIEQTMPEMDPFKKQLTDLGDQLQAADPTKDELPFPPVDMHIQLEDK